MSWSRRRSWEAHEIAREHIAWLKTQPGWDCAAAAAAISARYTVRNWREVEMLYAAAWNRLDDQLHEMLGRAA
jgi:hypothetical protein